MSEWEPFDDELAGAMRRRAGAAANDPLATESAHRSVLARASGIRRRRAAIAGGGTLTVLLVVGLVALNTGGGRDEATAPATDPTIFGSTVPETTSSSLPSSTTGPSMSTDTTTDVPVATDSMPGYPTSTDPAPPPTLPGTSEPGSTTSTSAPIGQWPPGEYNWPSTGGSITVYWSGSALTLVSVDPNPGYTAETHDQTSDRIRVDFTGADGDSRIECRVENGQLTLDIQ